MDLVLLVALLFAFSALSYGVLALRLLRGPREVGHVPVAITAIFIAAWVLGGAIELLARNEAVFLVGRMGHFLGSAFVPVGLFVAFRAYAGAVTNARCITVLCIVPVISVFLAATNSQHEWMWALPNVNNAGEFLVRPSEFGLWYLFAHAPHSYIVVTAAVLLLLIRSNGVGRAQRRGLVAFGVAALVPLIAVVSYDLGIGTQTTSPIPAVFTAMLPVYAWLIFGQKVIDFSPIALETVFQNMADPVVVLDDKGRVVSLNRGAESLLSVRESGVFRQSLAKLFGDDLPEVYEALDSGEPRKLMTSSGRFLHVQVSPIASGDSTLHTGTVVMFRDVSDVERAQAEVRNSEKLLRTLFDHSVNGLVRLRWHKDKDDLAPALRCVSANGAAAGFLKTKSQDLVGQTVDEVLLMATAGMPTDDATRIFESFHETINAGRVIDMEVRPEAGSSDRWLRMIGEPVGDNVALTFVDATDIKQREEHMESIASTDPLTGVLNRRGFETAASTHLRDSADDATGALLFVDLNQFKQINDRCGHETGDALLRIAAQRLRTSLRSCDIIGRPGGDEFVALVPDVAPDVAERLAERLTESLEEPYTIAAETLHCTASIGLALYPEHAGTLTGLLRAADMAMYRAKSRAHDLEKIGRRPLLEKAG